jgi:hypothetical protein
MTAANIWYDMLANHMTEAEAAQNWDLPEAAIAEIVRYCDSHGDLLAMEADEEKRFLLQKGVALEERGPA